MRRVGSTIGSKKRVALSFSFESSRPCAGAILAGHTLFRGVGDKRAASKNTKSKEQQQPKQTKSRTRLATAYTPHLGRGRRGVVARGLAPSHASHLQYSTAEQYSQYSTPATKKGGWFFGLSAENSRERSGVKRGLLACLGKGGREGAVSRTTFCFLHVCSRKKGGGGGWGGRKHRVGRVYVLTSTRAPESREPSFNGCDDIHPVVAERDRRRVRREDFNEAVPQRLAGAGEKAKVGTRIGVDPGRLAPVNTCRKCLA